LAGNLRQTIFLINDTRQAHGVQPRTCRNPNHLLWFRCSETRPRTPRLPTGEAGRQERSHRPL